MDEFVASGPNGDAVPVDMARAVGDSVLAQLRAAQARRKDDAMVSDPDMTARPETGPSRRPTASSENVTKMMRGNRGRDMRPEMRIRRTVRSLGLRCRVGVCPIPSLRRTADLVFPRARVVVFADACYWHGCPADYRPARLNADIWSSKITGNRQRDAETDARLLEAGLTDMRVWGT